MRFNGEVLNPGDTFAGYTVVRLLGTGGMSQVYVARHPRLPRTDALKVLTAACSDDPTFRQRFDREADLMARLSHPNIVTIHDRGETDGRLWLTMEMIDGQDLQHRLQASPRGLPTAEVEHVTHAVAAALDHAAAFTLLHRDVKPANILVDQHNRVALTDFGIARLVTATRLTGTGMAVGTLSYASPEQLFGNQLDSRADQYSLAATVFALLTGHPPFGATNPAQLISDHLSTPVPSVRSGRPDLPEAVDRVLARAMAKDPTGRFPTSGQFAQALSVALHVPTAEPATTVVAAPTQRLPRPTVSSKRHRPRTAAVAIAVVATLIVMTGGGLALWNLLVHKSSDGNYAAEAASLPRKPAGPLLRSLANKPARPLWTLPPGVWGTPATDVTDIDIVAANRTHVAFLNDSWDDHPPRLLMVDAATGSPIWPAPVDVGLDHHPTCGITESGSAIACRTGSADNVRVVIVNGSTGAPVADIPFGADSPLLTVGAENIALGTYGFRDRTLTVYRPDGNVAWSHHDTNGTQVYPEQGIVSMGTAQGATKVLRLDSGAEVFSSPNKGTVSVNVFTDGFAVSTTWRGDSAVEFFDLTGAKTGAGSGWSAVSSTDGDRPAPLPVLKNSGEESADNPHFGVVNPMTGHRLWEFQRFRGEKILPVGTHLVVGDRTLLVYDIYTGRAGAAPLTIENGINNVLGTDDSRIAFAEHDSRTMRDAIVVYDIATGAEQWRLDTPNKPVAFGDGIYQGASRII